ncbi:bifunctional [glutamate--ammonia ligase]-adenylyl-L-tyrosine phosphorylase/[glutamate--ammonia-ligase] adenylyltransferase [Methylogaea oryzae]|uniref:Bifunctional glutamine synthetase adenylyltransferase/adenylyl-removing enzyme n=1 Tax=Methylogaea oryzae TaxID=1295382 RepID=A0A8D5AGW2_9GAMM|nr:bifunctional [glutamate--ammonia ligase]-adenylyl-L-tyrosine phosphorylase/[glutamate--ammonia-ligase] adenylyltransferase [Methylogaea oryzae]BBL69626.1 glutamate-ammonia-ligase adenylyltransferase [Methylogaea oryzae]
MPQLPPPLSEKVARLLADFRERADATKLPLLDAPTLAESLPRVWAVSGFVAESCLRDPALLFGLLESDDLLADSGAAYYGQRLAESLPAVEDETELHRVLRRFRRREMVRIAWRDLAGWAELDETLADLSMLAECCLRAALEFLYGAACTRWGTPTDNRGRPQNLVVLGMGKLGGGELNFSSDIDLIFAYPEAGELPDKRGTSYQEFFTKLAQSLVKALDTNTEDGFVFRVDTRLRPFGDSGPLVMNFDAMEAYYQGQAREWERYAMIKARPVAGDLDAGAELEAMLKPFIYRRYLDYRAFGELRELKAKIAQELLRKDRTDSVKLGKGGIREIEFIGQAFQLLRGGRDKALQDRRIRVVLDALAEREYLPAEEIAKLQAAYRYLRLTENHIQQLADQQTHDLPKDDESRLRVAYSMGHSDWNSFKTELDEIFEQVHALFEQVIAPARDESGQGEARQVWSGGGDEESKAALLAGLGYPAPQEVLALLAAFRSGSAVARLTARGVAELDRLMPPLLQTVASARAPETTLKRILGLLEAVAKRNVYYTLLADNAAVLAQLVKLTDASPWIAALLAQHPILLDSLLDARQLYAPQKKGDLRKELARQLASVDADDPEDWMNRLRQFKQAQVLRVAAADIMEAIPLMVVSDYLTDIAEVLIEAALQDAWRHTVAKHGVPPGCRPEAVEGFAVIAYGKLGGIELSYSSDLDLVFLFDAERPEAATDGPRPVTVNQFYARIVQRMIHILTANMLAGVLYEVDMRLRPSGNSGLLVTSLTAFEAYQRDSAWTWEQQALVRARCVAGDAALGEKYRAARAKSLSRERDRAALQKEVREMREKMRDNLDSKDPAVFDLKQGFGGIADIEFIVQFGTLAHAAQHPALLEWTDNVRLLERLSDAGFLSRDEAEFLKQAYVGFRAQVHRAALQEQEARIPAAAAAETRARVQAIWRKLMES